VSRSWPAEEVLGPWKIFRLVRRFRFYLTLNSGEYKLGQDKMNHQRIISSIAELEDIAIEQDKPYKVFIIQALMTIVIKILATLIPKRLLILV